MNLQGNSLLVLRLLVALALCANGAATATDAKCNVPHAGDLMYVWGITGIVDNPQATVANFAQTSPSQHVKLLGVENVVMAGYGMPNDDAKAKQYTQDVSCCNDIIWEIAADDAAADGQVAAGFCYGKRMAQVRRLADEHPNVTGILLDDMSTQGRKHGFKPEHIRRIERFLPGEYQRVNIWGVVYTMSLGDEGINDYIKELDVISMWVWHAKDIPDIEKNIAHLEQLFPGKPITLGLYMYDYGGSRRMPMDLHQQQCETALKLAHAGRIQSIIFLSINDDAEIVGWTADWVKKVSGQKLGNS